MPIKTGMNSVEVIPKLPSGPTSSVKLTVDQNFFGKESDTNSSSFTFTTQTLNTVPPIPTVCVKERNFLVGRVEKPSSLYRENFHRSLPDGVLRLFIGTWNMQKCKIPENIDDFLLPRDEEFLQEIYVVGVQEATPEQESWEIKLQETLGTNHVLAHSVSHGLLHLAVFIRRDLMWYCTDFQDSKVSTRIISRLKTKGAIAVCFHCFGSSFLFVCSHFCSGERKTFDRIGNYHQISEKLNLPAQYKGSATDCTDRFDHVFWFGDLNFRISQPQQHMKSEVSDPSTYNISEAMKCDQLNRHMKKGKVFAGFLEPDISFLPTYKFDPESDEYDTSHKLRVPSYTDRILYKCKDVDCTKNLRYLSVMSLRHSDHRPVYAVYELVIKCGAVKACADVGQYNRDVYVKAARRRAHAMKKHESYVCSIL